VSGLVGIVGYPFAGRLALDLPLGDRLRVEAYALTLTPSDFALELVSDSTGGFTQRERYAYAGGQLEWTPGSRTALGIRGTWVRATMDRTPGLTGPVEDDFRLVEQTTEIGAYGMQRLSGHFSAEARVSRVMQPDDRTYRRSGAPPSELYEDRAWSGRVEGMYHAAGGFRGALGLDFLAREIPPPDAAGARAFLADNNFRLRFDLGWRFGDRASFMVGTNADLDGDNNTAIGAFDGAHGRFSLYW